MVPPLYNAHQKGSINDTVEESGTRSSPETRFSWNSANLHKSDIPQLHDQSPLTSSDQSDTVNHPASSTGRGEGFYEYDNSETLGSTFTTNSRPVLPKRATSKGSRTTRTVGVANESKQYTSDLTSTQGSFAPDDKTYYANSSEGGARYFHGVDDGKALGYTKTIDSFLPAHVSFESGATSTCRPHNQQGPLADHSQSSSTPDNSALSSGSDAQSQLAFLGYKQELYRTWDFWSTFSLAYCNVNVLAGSLFNMNGAIGASGPITMTVGYIVVSFFMLCVFATNAELASSFPVAGAMFTWTFKLARATPRLRNWARLLSWVIGFCLFSSHIIIQYQVGAEFTKHFTATFVASGVRWIASKQTQMGIILAYILTCGLISTTSFARSPTVWKILGVLSVMLHISVCTLMVCTAKQKRSFVQLFQYKDRHKLGFSKGYTFIFGTIATCVSLNSETAAHMAEETKNPASTVPNVIFWSYFFAIVMQLFSNLCVLLVLAPPKVRHTVHSEAPYLEAIFWHCPKPVSQLVACLVLFNTVVADIAQFLATSRYFWALAREKAIPMAKFWRGVTPDRRPVRATFLFIFMSMVTAVIAHEAGYYVRIVAVRTSSLLIVFSYVTPIILLLLAPKGVLVRDGRNVWTLRRFSRPVACMAACLLILTVGVAVGPQRGHGTLEAVPWCVPGAFLCLGISIALWFLYGRSHYVGPVKSLTIWTVGHEVEIPKRLPRNMMPQERKSNFETTFADPKATYGRSAAYLASEPARTFGVPQTYCTYQSDGSLWTPSTIKD